MHDMACGCHETRWLPIRPLRHSVLSPQHSHITPHTTRAQRGERGAVKSRVTQSLTLSHRAAVVCVLFSSRICTRTYCSLILVQATSGDLIDSRNPERSNRDMRSVVYHKGGSWGRPRSYMHRPARAWRSPWSCSSGASLQIPSVGRGCGTPRREGRRRRPLVAFLDTFCSMKPSAGTHGG